MSNQKAISIVYANSWALRIGQIFLWIFISLYLSPSEIADYGLWLVLVGAVSVVRLEGLALGILSSPNQNLKNTVFSAVLLHAMLGILLGAILFIWNKELLSLFHLEGCESLVRSYALVLPVSMLAQLGRRVLQKEGRFVDIFAFNWYSFIAQVLAISVAIFCDFPQVLVIGFLAGDLVRGICFGKVSLKAARGGQWDVLIRNHYQLGFMYALNQIAVFITSRGDIWILSSFLGKSTLAAYVIFKQFLAMIKSSVMDPAEEFVLPLLGSVQNRPSLSKIYVGIRRELNMSSELVHLAFTSSALLVFYFYGTVYAIEYRLFLAMVGVAVVSMHSFSLGQLSVTRGNGGEILMYKLSFAIILLFCYWMATESNLTSYLVFVIMIVAFLNLGFEWYSNRFDWGVEDVVFTSLSGVGIGLLGFLPLGVALILLIGLTLLLGYHWVHRGGLDLMKKRIDASR